MPATKQQIRQIIADNNLNSVADVYSLLRESFKDILQELMEAELDATLGYEKNQKGEVQTSNKRNGHSPKTLKEKSTEKIDGAVATIMGLDRAVRCGNQTSESVYDSRGRLVF